MLSLYRVLWWVLLPPILLYRLYRDISRSTGHRFSERLGFSKKAVPHDLLIHAVSLGEVRAVTPLVEALLREYPDLRILFTATTQTGSRQITESFAGRVTHLFLPLDQGWLINRFLKKIKPKCLLIMETEIWPNLFLAAERQRIPLYIISACLSQKSLHGYQKIPTSIRKLLANVHVMAQSEEDKSRFIMLGAQHVTVSGNLKYIVTLPAHYQETVNILINSKKNRLLWVLASSHEQEEALALDAYQALKKRFPELMLAIAPRHPERFIQVHELIKARNLSIQQRSQIDYDQFNDTVDIWFFDSIGELLFLYGVADIVVVGGTFIPIGGHNILEPAALAKPVVVGPYIDNIIADISFLEVHEAIVLTTEDTFLATIEKMCGSYVYRQTIGINAQQCVLKKQQVLPKILSEIKQYFIT